MNPSRLAWRFLATLFTALFLVLLTAEAAQAENGPFGDTRSVIQRSSSSASASSTCGECKGQVTDLTLQYNGTTTSMVKVRDNKGNVIFMGVLSPGQQFSFSGVQKDNKMGSRINIYIDGVFHVEIHTSCSQPIGPGLVRGDFEVIAGISREGGPLCPVPPNDCDVCSGGVNSLTLQYNGTTTATIRVEDKSGSPVIFNQTVAPGGDLTILPDAGQTKLPKEIKVFIDNVFNVQIHTSCSQPIEPGLIKGDFTIVEASSVKNGNICPIVGNGTIGDTVFEDLNGNGIQDAGDPGIVDVTVNLLRPGIDGVCGTADDIHLAEMMTLADGTYDFTGLVAGTYCVDIDESTLMPGFTLTTANEPMRVELGDGEDFNDADFGYEPPQPPASIGDFVWHDIDRDGIQDAGEPGLFDVTVRLYSTVDGTCGNADDVFVDAKMTDANGFYTFGMLDAGMYCVMVDAMTVPTGYTSTTTNEPLKVTVAPGDNFLDADFGYAAPAPQGSIGDRVWQDDNGDGIQDAGETGLNGVTVNLYAGVCGPAGAAIATQVTSGDGDYDFTGLAAGDYCVDVDETTLPGDFAHTTANDPLTVALGTDEDYNDADFGYQPAIVDLELTKTVDNATPQTGDTITFTLTLLNNAANANKGAKTIVVQDYFPAGDLTFVSANPQTGTTYDSNTHTWNVPYLGPGADVFVTIEAVVTASTSFKNCAEVMSHIRDDFDSTPGNFAAPNGTPAEDDESCVTITPPGAPMGSIGDRVWHDLNSDGVQDAGEPGLNGVTVNLYSGACGPTGSAIATQVTSGDGDYDFTGLAAGTYCVDVDNTTVPAGYTHTTANDPLTVALGTNEDFNDADFGYVAPAPPQGSIGDFIWNDLDGDGIQDAGEPGLPNVLVTLYAPGNDGLCGTGDDVWLANTNTDANGAYDFAGLSAGMYCVDVDENTVPFGFVSTTTNDPLKVTLGVDEDFNDADFGYFDDPTGDNEVDLELDKIVSVPSYWPNEQFAYTLVVTNNSGVDATNIIVKDYLPASLTLAFASTTAGSFDENTLKWTIPALGAWQTATLNLSVIAGPDNSVAIENCAEIWDASPADTDSTPANFGGTVAEDDEACATIDPPSGPNGNGTADLEVSKSVDNASPEPGEEVTFTVNVKNNGPEEATGVQIRDVLGFGFIFEWATTTSGTYDEVAGIWDIPTMAVNGTVTLTLGVKIDAAADGYRLVNSAHIMAADQVDLNPDNNAAIAEVFINTLGQASGTADIDVDVVVDNPAPKLNDPVTWTVTVTNNGPDDADNLVIKAPLPLGLVYQSHTTTVGTFDPVSGIWVINDLANGATVQLTVTTAVILSNQLEYQAHVVQLAQTDPILDNNADRDIVRAKAIVGMGGLSLPICEDLGNGFVEQTALINTVIQGIVVAPNGDLIAGTYGYGVVISSDGGTCWRFANDGLGNLLVMDIVQRQNGDLFIGTWADGMGGIWRSTDGGTTWTFVDLANRQVLSLAVDPNNDSILYAGLNLSGETALYRSTDGGTTWGPHGSFAAPVWSLALDPNSNEIALATISNQPTSGVYRSTDGGLSFIQIGGPADGLAKVSALSYGPASPYAGTLFAGTESGVRTYNGSAWNTFGTGLAGEEVRSLAFEGAFVYAGTAQSGLFRYESGNWVSLGLDGVTVLIVMPLPSGDILLGTEGLGFVMAQPSSISTGTEDEPTTDTTLPTSFALGQNYPNPFNPQTTIDFSVQEAMQVRMSVYDMLGREITVLVDGMVQPGQHTVTFEAGDLPSGTYLYRMETPVKSVVKTMVLLK